MEPDLTLKKAFEVAQAIESADTQVKELQNPRMAEVHAVSPQFRPFRVPVLHNAPIDDRLPTPTTTTHCDRRLFIRRAPLRRLLVCRSPLSNALLHYSHGPHA